MIRIGPAFIVSLIIFLFGWTYEAAAGKVVRSIKVDDSPLVDGFETEDVWRQAEAVTTSDPVAGIEITLKSVHTASTIYFLVSFPDPDESRTHRVWHWNSGKGMYEEGPEREDVFVFKWKLRDDTPDLSVFSDEPYEADIWFWKAHRTDSLGFADDKVQRLLTYPAKDTLEVTSRSGRKMYLQRQGDAGRSVYKTKIYVDYESDTVQRYFLRQPEGSRADIKANGVWLEGRWTIEFARPLITGHEDDVNFRSLEKSYGFGVSRYEIGGRPPEYDSEQPLYGSGDITEMLTLEFQR